MAGSSGASALARRRFLRGAIDEDRAFAQRVAEKHVLGDGQLRNLLQLLMDHGDAGAPRIERTAQGQRLAVDGDRAAVGLQDARQGAQQGRFAGAVLAEQGVNLARTYAQRHVAERFDAGKRLGHMLDIEPQGASAMRSPSRGEERLP